MKRLPLIYQFSILCFIALVLIGMVLGWTVSNSMERNMLARSIKETSNVVFQNVTKHFEASDLLTPKTGDEYEEFAEEVEHLSLGPNVFKIEFWGKDKEILWSHNREMVGLSFGDNDDLDKALGGEIATEINSPEKLQEKYRRSGEGTRTLELYVPIWFQDKEKVDAVAEVYENLGPLYESIAHHKHIIWTRITVGFLLLYFVLFGIVFGASRLIERQTGELEEMFIQTTVAMGNALDAKSSWTRGHSERVMIHAEEIAKEMGLSKDDIKRLVLAGLLHDIGKIGTYDRLLDKNGKLTEEEFGIIRKHPEQGVKILREVKLLEKILPLIRYHHERYDGKGYPDGLGGEEIPLLARILHVADSYDAMTADRPYRKALNHEHAREELRMHSGTQFDPEVVGTFLSILEKQQDEKRYSDARERSVLGASVTT